MENEFVCQYCGKVFDSGAKLGGHSVQCEPSIIDRYGSVENFKIQKKIKHLFIIQKRKEELNKEWELSKHFCEYCGEQFFEKYGSGRFCCEKCARSYSNKNDKKSKIKIVNCIKCGLPMQITKYANPQKCVCDQCKNKACSICGKKISYKNKSGICRICLNHQPASDEQKLHQSKTMKEKNYPRWNIHRNKSSFAENFFEQVLVNNNIEYEREFGVLNENGHYYYLDFLITLSNYKIDLEIDGKQHEYRKEHDAIRDEFLNKQNYLIYRIQWNEINSDIGKNKITEKINDFLTFYKNLI